MVFKTAYKIIDNRASLCNYDVVPAGWIEYIVGSEPQELVDGLSYRTDEELEDEAYTEFLENESKAKKAKWKLDKKKNG